jgi:hypothetical protein
MEDSVGADISVHDARPGEAERERSGKFGTDAAGESARSEGSADSNDAFIATVKGLVQPFDDAIAFELPELAS